MDYYILTDQETADNLIEVVKIAKHKMKRIKDLSNFSRILALAPFFQFKKTSDFLQALEATNIVAIVKPNRKYICEVLSHDNTTQKVLLNEVWEDVITEEEIEDIIMENFPLVM